MSRPLIVGGAVLALVALFFYVLPQPGAPARVAVAVPGFAVHDVRLFDGERFSDHADVVVRAGRVVAVGRGLALPADLPVVEGAGATLLPGLIDAHVHTYGTGLADAINFGVTTVLDMFTDPTFAAELRPGRERLAPQAYADLYSAGWLATVPGGHGTEYGLAVPTLNGPAEAEAWVAARLAEGSDWIKIVYEPQGAAVAAGAAFASIDRPTLAALVAAAHRHGRLAVVHVSRLEAARDALETGADGLAHVFCDVAADPAFVALARDRHAFVIATLSVIAAFGGEPAGPALAADPELAPYLSPTQRRSLLPDTQRQVPRFHPDAARSAVKALAAAGVDVLAGTDAPNPGTAQGVSLHGELALLVGAGLTPDAALAAATSVPARRFGLEGRGRVVPGARADLLLVRGDPSQDIHATRAILAIWKNGARVERRRYPAPEA